MNENGVGIDGYEEILDERESGPTAVIWDWEGQTKEGTLKDIQQVTVGARTTNLYVFSSNEGDYSVWETSVLKTKLSSVVYGDVCLIQYEGQRTNKSGLPYRDFRVYVKRNNS